MKKLLPIIILVLVTFSSCKYEKLLKSRDYKLKYTKALEYYEEEDYVRADGLFEQLKPVLKGTKQADTVFFIVLIVIIIRVIICLRPIILMSLEKLTATVILWKKQSI